MTLPSSLAPCQLICIAFDNLRFDSRVWDAIRGMEQRGHIRIIDTALLARTIDDDIVVIEYSQLPLGHPPVYGSIVRRLLGLEGTLLAPAKEMALGDAMLVDSEYEYGMTAQELLTVLEDIPRRGGMAAILVEHRWELPLKLAVHDTGGYLLAQDFLSPEVLVGVSGHLLRG
jgi:hypothetical protein